MSLAVSDIHLHIQELSLRIGQFSLNRINLSCKKGEYHILMGPNGSGKSTLMKAILGLIPIKKGRVHLGGINITDLAPECRGMGYVPQNYALFPHLNVERNIAFGLKRKNLSRRETDAIINKVCDMLHIAHLRDRDIQGLSGGEKQKVALGRALAVQPQIILLDEPFSAIDESARRALWFELKQTITDVGVTALHITHNLEEAYTLGERISVLIKGNLVQSGLKEDIFKFPVVREVAEYLNYRNLFSGKTNAGHEYTSIDCGHFSITVNKVLPSGKDVGICIRQQDIKIIKEDSPVKDSLKKNIFSGEIVSLFPLPEFCLMWFKIQDSPKEYDLELKFPDYIRLRHDLHPGKKIRVGIWEPNIIVFE